MQGAERADLPTGTVTFLFTDIEGSTELLQRLGEDGYHKVIDDHHSLLRKIFESHGVVVSTEGDAFFAAFAAAPEAVAAAVEAQRALEEHSWAHGEPVAVRMGMHTGEGRIGGDNYVGLDVHRAARIASAAHGGQVLLSEVTATLAESKLPGGVEFKDLGEHRLKDLSRAERIYQLVVSELRSDFPPVKSLESRPNNLPVQVTSFIGRERELDELEAVLADSRLVTLTGPGGTGKTRLSLELGARSIDGFRHGVFFVPLAPISDPELVPPAILEALNLTQAADARPPLERVRHYLKDKEMLLILDNFEQILAAASVVSDLVREAPEIKVVASSRAPLHISGEREYPVPPLATPDPAHLPDLESLSQYEAVALFIQRATAVKPGFEVTNENAPAVAEICARLDGLPLAIELAAARVRLLSPQAILERLGERLKLLAGGARDLPERQQTLRQAIAWSYDLLDEAERSLFARAGVFVGGFTLEQAEEVCGPAEEIGMDVFDGVASLVEKSLIKASEDAGEPRFQMLETIREYALERLAEAPEAGEIERRHAFAYLQLAEKAASELLGRERKRWLDRIDSDHDNLRAALSWAVERRERAVAQRLAAALWRFWQMRGHLLEGARRVQGALAISDADDRSPERGRALQAAGGLTYWQGDPERARGYYAEAVEVWRAVGDKSKLAEALYDSAFGYLTLADADKMGARLNEALELAREVGDELIEARVNWGLSALDNIAGDADRIRRRSERALEVFERRGEVFSALWAHNSLGESGRIAEDYPRAAAHYKEALRLGYEAEDLTAILFQLNNLSHIAGKQGSTDRAVRLAAAVTALKVASGAALVDINDEMRNISRITSEDLDDDRLQSIWEEARRWTVDEAVAYALENQTQN